MPDTKYKIQPRHEALKPLCWLEGTWRNESPGKGQFPTIKPFQFMEELKFTSVGQPIFNYRAESWYPDTKAPMHFECGFLKIIPNTNKLVFLLTHTFAVTTIQEGEVCDKQIVLTSTSIERPTEGGNATKVLKVTFRRKI